MITLRKIASKLSRLRFSTKLFLSYFVLFCVFIILLIALNYHHVAQRNEAQAIFANEQAMQQTVSFLEYKLSSLRNIINIISSDETIQAILKTGDTYYRENRGNWFIQTTDMKNIIYNSYLTSDIRSVQLYMKKGPASFEESDSFKRLDEAARSEWYTRLEQTALLGTIWVPSLFFDAQTDNCISVIKRIPDFNSINKYVGVIKGDIPQIIFQQIVEQTPTTVNTTVALYNEHHEMIAFRGDAAFQQVAFLANTISSHKLSMDGTLHKMTIDKKRYLVGAQNIQSANWTLVMLIPDKDLLPSTRAYRNQSLLLLLVLLGGSLPLLYITSRSSVSRLQRLKQHMEQSVESNFKIAPLKNGDDEIGELTITFDEMANRIRTLLEEQYRLGYEIKNLELKVLQSLINPHFLYNTLDMIYWLSIRQNATQSAHAAQELAHFYKLSLGHGEYFVTLQQELSHVRAYTSLQNMRFENKIHLDIQVPLELLSCLIVKIVLQPLVENSILHGILEKSSESGTIFIRAWEKNHVIHLTVADNGIGMSAAQLALFEEKQGAGKGYGIWNIAERIRVTYGDTYHLHFCSVVGKGTCAFLTFPQQFDK